VGHTTIESNGRAGRLHMLLPLARAGAIIFSTVGHRRMHGIFINYRRDDSRGLAGRLSDHLRRTFGADAVFMDVDAMKPGFDFVKQLDTQVAQCDVVLAIIGANWFNAHDDKGQRRLDSSRDYVRIELAAALTRDIPVIPVLLDGAMLPPEDELPDDLKSLARRHALELRYTRFNSDAEGIEFALRSLLPQMKRKWLMPAVGGGVAVACIAAFFVWRMLPPHIVVPPGPGVQPIVVPQPVKPKAEAPIGDARRALEAAATSGDLRVALGDSIDRVKSVYHITSEPFMSGSSLALRLQSSGIFFFFTESDKTLNNIRVDAPFDGSVEGYHIGDPVSSILSRLGEPYTTPWDFGDNKAYAYRVGGRTVRFDIDKAGKIATIFQFTSK
jgi:hypothetical protein